MVTSGNFIILVAIQICANQASTRSKNGTDPLHLDKILQLQDLAINTWITCVIFGQSREIYEKIGQTNPSVVRTCKCLLD